ncbi:M28 family metallopeptidase [Aquisalinus flavus]|uniref:Peptidase M28 domain-containing protein n=1 Tax=Aquisalinus flavus TaxID=1526572 RepID=A0A8J2V1Z2_9PROT|nr:M28 family metallopeptidase [Aquisalinus flavus]MBD0426608.1 M28 family peptidase [Aquisalinus flavus]UNE47847.1 M28 family peptidase [Aquisalinus flavus]GGD06542.1 hypothetical protein GCM10011342_14260 [Aquisalinus flavus]
MTRTILTKAGALAAISVLAVAACTEDTPPPENGGAELEAPVSDAAMPVTAEGDANPQMASASFDIPAIPSLPAIDTEALRSGIATLASDAFEGRAPATPGGQKTVAWLEQQFSDIGLEPALGDSYRQDVPLVEITADPRQSYLTINEDDGASRTLAYGAETVFWTKNVVENVTFDDSDMVFVGFGIVAPEYGWNDYEGIDAEGKTVVMLINDPGFYLEDEDMFNGKAMTYYGRWTYKFEEAARQGADAAIIVHQTAPASYGWGVVEGSWSGPQIDLQRPDAGNRADMEAWITEDVATELFASAGLDFAEQAASALTADFAPVPMTGLSASGKIANTISRSNSANVAAILPGSEMPDEYVLYMAHWDHIGRIADAEPDEDAIYNGAVDNATGTVGIVEIARSFAAAETAPERSLLFVAVTAEESGLLGSAYMADYPIVPLDAIVGGVNIDALLPTPPARDLVVIGYGASELEALLEAAGANRNMYLRPDANPQAGYFYRSDHISLAKKGVPMLYADSGIDLVEGGEDAGRVFSDDYTENHYHAPSDEYSPDWDLSGIVSTLEVLRDTGAYMAYSDIQPNWYEGNEFRALRDQMMAD